ncbi:hypothetical protein [Leifsonia sp. Leaf264]|uniref:hypothetical protein n=1 Tax=Leifsonia sp. Leaf264 TaxID=1736314 RepID=UPI0006F58884|nr:hypothetical protein [Leifsonia sp. Leaf264]KQO98881.1 hypothetical protein ASF30_12525 [Leifsonia sp. Leaf264]
MTRHYGFTPKGEAEPRFANQFIRVEETPVVRPDGEDGFFTTVTPGTGNGVVVIPRTFIRGLPYFALVSQHRPPIGGQSLEFPRGATKDLDSVSAAREVVEEVGCEVNGEPLRIGTIHPDTGLLTTTVATYLAACTTTEDAVFLDQDSYREESSGAIHHWVNGGTLQGLISRGQITCGFTIAAWAQLVATGRNISAL